MFRRPKDSWRTKTLPENSPLRLSSEAYDRVVNNGRSQAGFTLNSDRSIWIWPRASNTTLQSGLRVKPASERPLLTTRSQASEESRRGEFSGKVFVLHESFGRRNTRIWSEIYWALWNCCFYCDSGLFLLRRKRFVEWGLASDGWSGRPSYSFSNRFRITSLNVVRMALNSPQETSSSHIWGRKTLFQMR